MRKREAALYLGLTVRALTELMRRHVVAFHKIGYKMVLFRQDDLDAAMARYRVAAVGE